MLDIIDCASRAPVNEPVEEEELEITESDEEEAFYLAVPHTPPHQPHALTFPKALQPRTSSSFGVSYEILRPEVQTYYIMLHLTKETRVNVFRSGPSEITITQKFVYEPTTVSALELILGKCGQEWLRHLLPEQTAVKIFTIPFTIGTIAPTRNVVENVFVVRICPPVGDATMNY